MFAYLIWNPDKNIFILPYLNHPVTWYGFLFALGFLAAFFITRKMLTEFLADSDQNMQAVQAKAMELTDRLSFCVIIGAVVGARLGHVFFYDWAYYQLHPGEILKVWQGGLASHGAALGVLIALVVFLKLVKQRAPQITFMALLDTLMIPVVLAGGGIRVGNFINQEITGTPTTLPWGVIFMHPLDGIPNIPLHPVQLYEALFYFSVSLFLLLMWKRDKKQLGNGLLSGWFFLLVFGFRFFIEYVKMPQNLYVDTSGWITMGQLLSIPFAFLGGYLLIKSYKRRFFLHDVRKKDKILIAGARGMVGSALVRQFISQGYTQLLTPSHQELDCAEQLAVREFLKRHKPDVVVIAAAKVGGIWANMSYPAEFIYINLMIACNLIHEAHAANVRRVLFLGSSCIYPREAPQPIPESALLTGPLEQTNEAYALAKIAGIKLCQYYRKQYGRHYISAMPTNLYGPNDNYHPENSHVIPGMIRRFHEAKVGGAGEVAIWGTGSALREFLYVDDLASACMHLLMHYDGEEHVNVGSEEELTIRELARRVAEAVGYKGGLAHDLSKPDGTPRKKTDVSRIFALGWRPVVSLKEGLKRSYADFCSRFAL